MGVSVLRNGVMACLLQGEGKAIVEAAGGVYEWCRITFFIETIGVIDFIVRGVYSWGRYCYPISWGLFMKWG